MPTPIKYNAYETWLSGQKQCKTIMYLAFIKKKKPFAFEKKKSLLTAEASTEAASAYTI